MVAPDLAAHRMSAGSLLAEARRATSAVAAEPWITIAAALLASRLVVLFAALVAESLVVRNPALTSGDNAPVLRSLTSWDGWWYLGIARDGYHAAPISGDYPDFSFFPLYPLLVRALSAPWPGFAGLVAVLLSNVAFAVALALLYELGRPYLGRVRAARAARLMAILPFAAVFAMAYSESLFLALMLAAFLAAERNRRAWAGALFALAALTRFQGIVLIVPLWLAMARHDGWRPRPSQSWLLLGPMAAVGYLAYVAQLTGDWRAYMRAYAAWGRVGVGNIPAGETLGANLSPFLLALLATLLVGVFLLVYLRPDGIRLEYALVPILFLGAVFGSGQLESVGRVTMVAFPYVWVLANRRNRLFRQAWPLVSVGLLGAISLLTFVGYWQP